MTPRFVSMATRGRSWWRLAKPRNGLSVLEWARVGEVVVLFVILCALVSFLVDGMYR